MPRRARWRRRPGSRSAWWAAVGLPVDEPRQLVIPAGVQVEPIYPGHEHIDLIYFAVPARAGQPIEAEYREHDRVGWYAQAELAQLGASEEIQAWARRAVAEVGRADRTDRRDLSQRLYYK